MEDHFIDLGMEGAPPVSPMMLRPKITPRLHSERVYFIFIAFQRYMPPKQLKIDSLDLDLENPRITLASDQRDAMRKVLKEQGAKLINLAESIADNGLNPMDRFLVLRSDRPGKFIVLEGNRRLLALKLLKNAPLVNSLEMTAAYRKRLLAAGQRFKASNIEPLDCYEVADHAEGVDWIVRRHTGENSGKGIVAWSGLAANRFRGRDPGLQALDFVLEHGDLDDQLKDQISAKFPISTLERLLATPSVRHAIGFDIRNKKLETELPAAEALKPLKRLVVDLAMNTINVSLVKTRKQQEEYIGKLKHADRPDLTKKTGSVSSVDSMTDRDFAPTSGSGSKKSRATRVGPRRTIVPKSCKLTITNAKIEKIYGELKILQLSRHVHAIGVLLRVFLEMSVDDYLVNQAGAKLTFVEPKSGRNIDKKLAPKINDAIAHMVSNGANRKDFKGVLSGLGDDNHPFSIDTLHAYIHNRFFTPTEGNLTTGWDNAQRFFETIWP
jgi:hypothetical protein